MSNDMHTIRLALAYWRKTADLLQSPAEGDDPDDLLFPRLIAERRIAQWEARERAALAEHGPLRPPPPTDGWPSHDIA